MDVSHSYFHKLLLKLIIIVTKMISFMSTYIDLFSSKRSALRHSYNIQKLEFMSPQ